jgi:hypothetical protein
MHIGIHAQLTSAHTVTISTVSTVHDYQECMKSEIFLLISKTIQGSSMCVHVC